MLSSTLSILPRVERLYAGRICASFQKRYRQFSGEKRSRILPGVGVGDVCFREGNTGGTESTGSMSGFDTADEPVTPLD